jgi:STE24 endopeptidase
VNEDRAARYHRLRRRATLLSSAAGVGWLVLLLYFGWSAALAAIAAPRPVVIAVCVLVTALGWEIFSFPFVFYRTFILERKYGLSSEPLGTWFGDHMKALSLGLAFSAAGGLGVYGAMHLWPRWWWLASAGAFGAVALVLSQLAPVVLMPLFYRFRPLERDTLRARLTMLSEQAGVTVLGAFEWGLGEKTTRANAALVGAGGTRRILVSDTLLKDFSDDEIEVILAHEIAHHVYRDMWSALALEIAVVAAALLAAHVTLVRAGHVPSDLAALPILAIAAGSVSVLLTPIANAWSRHNERRADRFALRLTGRPAAFISAMRRLGAQNLAEERPSALVRWFFHTHPTIDERIAAARVEQV